VITAAEAEAGRPLEARAGGGKRGGRRAPEWKPWTPGPPVADLVACRDGPAPDRPPPGPRPGASLPSEGRGDFGGYPVLAVYGEQVPRSPAGSTGSSRGGSTSSTPGGHHPLASRPGHAARSGRPGSRGAGGKDSRSAAAAVSEAGVGGRPERRPTKVAGVTRFGNPPNPKDAL